MNDSVLSKLVHIYRKWQRIYRSELAPYNYIGTMHYIIIYLSCHPGSSQEDIATFYFLDKTGIARDARRLEDMGHIRREIMPKSRRQYKLYLTKNGEEMMEILKRIYNDFQNKISSGLSSENWQTLNDLLGQIDKNCFSDLVVCKKNKNDI